MEFDADLNACADLLRRADPDRFRAVMAAPVAARARLFPLYAFNAEVARAPWVTAEAMIAEMRLQWWHDVLTEIEAGGPVRRHEVATPLARVLDTEGARLLKPLVEARRWDIYRDPFEDGAALRAHLEATSGNLLLAGARALAELPDAAPLRDAGFALGVANWLRAVPALEGAGRLPLADGRPAAVAELAEDGLTALARARAARGRVPAAARPVLLVLWQTGTILKRARQDPRRVADGRLEIAPLQSRAMLMARALTGRW